MTLASQTDDEIEGYYNEISSAFNKAIETLHKAGKYDPKMLEDGNGAELIRKISSVLAKPLDNIELKRKIPQELSSALRENVFIFSGFKTAKELEEASAMLHDDDGNTKPFSTFYKDVKSIDATYNRNYLHAEYNYATSSCQMAVKWKDWEQDGDDYDLQYRTANDDRVREEHQELDGTTLPPSDPFWRSYLPPNGWNCRCTAVQVRKGKYPESDSEEAIRKGDAITSSPKQRMFRFNPGIQLKVFPDKHPYFPKGCGDCNRSMLSYNPNNVDCQNCKAINNLNNKREEDDSNAVTEARKQAIDAISFENELLGLENIHTGFLYKSRKSIKNLYRHAFTDAEIEAATHVIDNTDKLKFVRHSYLGEGKNLKDPKEREKIEKKIERGVIQYNVYLYEYKGRRWTIKTEEYWDGQEKLYSFTKKP